MDITKESLLYIIIALVGYGVKIIETNSWLGAGCLIAGAILLIVRAWLKKKGYDIAGR